MLLHDVVVGIDVASDSFVAAILAPDASVYKQPKKYNMNTNGFATFCSVLNKTKKWFNNSPKIFLESTGIYHRPLFLYLINNGFDAFIINPVSIKNITFEGLRKVKNDNRDSLKIALACKQLNIPTCYVPDPHTQALRNLVRTYYSLTDNRADLKIKLGNELHSGFPGLKGVFSDITGLTPLKFLELCPSPKAFVDTPKDDVITLFITYSRKGSTWANKKYDLIFKLSTEALKFNDMLFLDIGVKTYISIINQLTTQLNLLVVEIENLLHQDKNFIQHKVDVELLSSLDGVGFISAVSLVAEIGDLSRFSSPKQLTAYMGIDPSVNESGNFKGNRNHMSKRGSRLGRRVLFTVSMASVRTSRSGEPINPVLRDYYIDKCTSKKKKVALGAIMHKLTKYIFAILRDQKPYELRTPEKHKSMHQNFQLLEVA